MKYWLCTKRGYSSICEESYEEYYPVVGTLVETEDNELPESTHSDDEWVKISKDDYKKAIKDENYIFKYDGVHCIGKCTECKNFKEDIYIRASDGNIYEGIDCLSKGRVIKSSNTFDNCCELKE